MSHKIQMNQLISTPAVGFDQPFEMLDACHDRVDRTLTLLQRLAAHIDSKGHDASSRSAANDVLRYFDLAAPHHHLDEERHVFPPLIASGKPEWVRAVNTLLKDHAELHQLWAELRPVIRTWTCTEPAPDPVSEQMRQTVKAYCDRYSEHKLLEDGTVYPAARGLIPGSEALQVMGAEMRERRQHTPALSSR